MGRRAVPKLSLADLMILIAATGLGLGCFVLIDDNLYEGARFLFGVFKAPGVWNSATILARLQGVSAMMMTAFGGWMLALPILAFLRPKPSRRRLSSGAGLSACLSALVGMAALVATTGLAFLLRWIEGRTSLPTNFWYDVPIVECLFMFPGVAVAATWTLQVATHRFRPMADPIDRLGRFVGALWASAGLVFAVRLFLG